MKRTNCILNESTLPEIPPTEDKKKEIYILPDLEEVIEIINSACKDYLDDNFIVLFRNDLHMHILGLNTVLKDRKGITE